MNEVAGKFPSRTAPLQSAAGTTAEHLPRSEVKPIDFREIVAFARRNFLLVTLVALAVFIPAAYFVLTIPATYTASSKVIVGAQGPRVAAPSALYPEETVDAATLLSEIEVIRSPQLVAEVIAETGYASVVVEPAPITEVLSAIRRTLSSVKATLLSEPREPEAVASVPSAEDVMNRFMAALQVTPIDRSRVIRIAFTDQDPELAANVANTMADRYITQQVQAKFDATEKVNLWLGERLAGLKEEVETKERAVDQLRGELMEETGRAPAVLRAEIEDTSIELVKARSELSAKEALRQRAQSAIEAEGMRGIFTVVSSPLSDGLRRAEADVRQRLGEAESQLADRHPRLVTLRSEYESLRAQLDREAETLWQKVQSDAAVAREHVRSLTNRLSELQAQESRVGSAEIQLRSLEREAEASRALLESFLSRFEESQQFIGVEQPNAWIIANALLPTTPSGPARAMLLGGWLVVGLALGLAVALAAESRRSGFENWQDVQAELNAPCLGTIPLLRNRFGLRRSAPHDQVVDDPMSDYAEALRHLWVSIKALQVQSRRNNVIMFTSALPNEGKSTMALSLGRVCAIGGMKTIIVDTDLRRPSLAAMLRDRSGVGLSDVLSGRASLSDAVRTDARTGLHYLVTSAAPDRALGLMESQQMKSVLHELAVRYDVVLLDSAPILAASDVRAIASRVGLSVLVVQWLSTSREVARLAVEQLRRAGSDAIGVAVSQVNVRQATSYGGESMGHLAAVSRYYSKKPPVQPVTPEAS